jgi:flavin-dependent dehydrogenase
VGLGVALGGTPEPEDIKELFKKTLEKDDGLNLRLHGAKMVSEIEVRELNLYDPTVPLVSDRVMLVGLAAGLANPFNGEGIQLGLLSAKWAAETAKWCMQNRNFSALLLSGYPRHINHELGGGYKVSALIMSLLRNRRLNDTWLEWLTYMGQKTVDDSDYLDLISSVLSGMVFPDEETSMKAFLGSLEEAAKKKGVNILQNSQNMQNIAGDNRDAAQYVAQNPIAAILFGVDALTKATEIAASLSKKTFKETNPSQEPQHQQ